MRTEIAAGVRIEPIDTTSATGPLMREVVALQTAIDVEERPEDPPYAPEIVEARYRATSPFFPRREWGAFADGRLVGHAGFVQNKTGSNEHIREVRVLVDLAYRRRGIGRGLFAAGLATVGDDAKLLEWWTTTRVPASEAASGSVGAKRGLHMRVSQVDLRTIDRDLMKTWAAIDPAGYRLEWVLAEDLPDRLMPATIQAFSAINRMPREDLEMEDWKFTPETLRDWERVRKERGMEQYLVLAIHEATGSGAAFTDVVFDRRYPYVIHQGGTAVDPAHQGKSLGKWLKARMALRVLEDFPDARVIRTDNAGTNAKMLAINDQMGFAEAWWGDIWQISLADAKRYVERGR